MAQSIVTHIATGEMYVAASFQTDTKCLMGVAFAWHRVNQRMVLIAGGLPIQVGSRFYGAIGFSGAPAEKCTGNLDEACASAGLSAIVEELECAE